MADTQEKSKVALREEEILAFWKERGIFEKSVATPAGKEPKGEFVFYDGPPFATGLPHYGHLVGGTLKDLVPRYKTMKGYRVNRRWGWDCHGLPVENLVEKALDLKTKKDIEEYGIEKFNAKACEMVLEYTGDWEKIIPRVGRFVDMENAYRTMDAPYTESIWWAFKTLHDKGLISEGYKSMHLCPRCETTLANFEVNQGYKDITDISVYVKFELADEPGTFMLAWTTTPWTLPGNAALAVNPDFEYVKIKAGGDTLVLAKDRLAEITQEYEIIGTLAGVDLVGKAYIPLFDYYAGSDIKNKENGWKIYGADFVTAEDGTGVVHIAPAFGEDDMSLAQKNNLPFIQHVSTDGQMKPEARDFAGMQAKPKDDHQKTDVEVIKHLAAHGTLFAKKKIVHSYPHCWRCDTPLLNYAATSWFVKVTQIKDELIANNKKTEWVPEHMRDGRFGKWLEGARDWAISRSRFWGAPIPVWRCKECKETKVIGSLAELAAARPVSERYFVLRHGEAGHIVKGVADSGFKEAFSLTEKGRQQVKASAAGLVGKGITRVVASPVLRAKESAEIAARELGLDPSAIVYDERLREIRFGDFDGKPIAQYRAFFPALADRFTKRVPNGENLAEIRDRVTAALYEHMEKNPGENILFVGHETPLWMLAAGAGGASTAEALAMSLNDDFLSPGQSRELAMKKLPYNRSFGLDLHRPFIDDVVFPCSCGGEFARIPDVFDCWFESGAMPFAERHYPFENKQEFEDNFPADFIAEGLDQTRGWFYSLMVLSTALFGKATFKQVVVNGLILAEDGQKMSKRLQNYPELSYILDKYGADTLRFYLMSSPAVRAEDLNFSERGVGEVSNKVVGRLLNVLSFFELNKTQESNPSESLDRWILSRLTETRDLVEASLEAYEIDRASRPIADFIEDFSIWYIRRSRKNFSAQITRHVLVNLAKIMAPFTPFLSEHIYLAVRNETDPESVHLAAWPVGGELDADLVTKMAATRKLVESALAARSKSGIKVRQPLAKLAVKETADVFADLVKDELNVKEVVFDPTIADEVWLDTEITPELAIEGEYRELVREIQDKRKEMGLSPADRIGISYGPEYSDVVARFAEDLKKQVGATTLSLQDVAGIVISR